MTFFKKLIESGRQNIVFRVKLVIMRSACFTPGHGIRDKWLRFLNRGLDLVKTSY
jgi:hypothetical protein